MMTRFLAPVALLSLGLLLGSCSSFAGFVSDYWPHWAGGEPNGLPPRPGSPGYAAFIAHHEADKSATTATPSPPTAAPAAKTATANTATANAATASTATPNTATANTATANTATAKTANVGTAPATNPLPDDRNAVQGGLY